MSLTCNSSSRWKVVFFCGYNQCCRSGVMTSIFLFDNVVCCVSLYIDAKAREAYSTGQNVYVPSPQVWLSFNRWYPFLGLSASCLATFWQLFILRATFLHSEQFPLVFYQFWISVLVGNLWIFFEKRAWSSLHPPPPPPNWARSRAKDAHSRAAKSAGCFFFKENFKWQTKFIFTLDWHKCLTCGEECHCDDNLLADIIIFARLTLILIHSLYSYIFWF